MREDCKSISGGVWICVEVTLLDGEGLEWWNTYKNVLEGLRVVESEDDIID
jgi:hypothetical protein